MRLCYLAIILLGMVSAGAANAMFLPPNNLDQQDRILGLDAQTGITEDQFNQVIDKVYNAMEPSVALHGATLQVERLWNNSTVNAMSQQYFNKWVVFMYGGLARRPEINVDGFTLVMCHEMGHHLGGYPFYPIVRRWAAAEGQADYFATEVCAKKVWGDDKVENAKARFDVPQSAKDKCDSVYQNADDQNLCYRTALGAMSLGAMLHTLAKGPTPEFATPDTSQVSHTNASYPSVQCRLDTYMSGDLCTAAFDLALIPGRRGEFKSQGSKDAEEEADRYSCTKSGQYKVGMRPPCWYKDNY